jgi:hypothetical protein
MATALSRYRFVHKTAEIGPQLERNWDAIIPRVEKTYGNPLIKALVPGFKLGGSTWATRLAALRARMKAGPALTAKEQKALKAKLHGMEAWLLAALLCEAGQGPHPGTSLLDVEVEALPGSGRTAWAPKRDVVGCTQLMAEVLHDYAPDSPLGEQLEKALKNSNSAQFYKVFTRVVRSEAASKLKGTWSLLAASELLRPFKAGAGKRECYAF